QGRRLQCSPSGPVMARCLSFGPTAHPGPVAASRSTTIAITSFALAQSLIAGRDPAGHGMARADALAAGGAQPSCTRTVRHWELAGPPAGLLYAEPVPCGPLAPSNPPPRKPPTPAPPRPSPRT